MQSREKLISGGTDMKKGWIIGIVALVLVIAAVAIYWQTNIGNRQLLDT